ncbi:MAG TPA: hypothetical protein PLX90_03795 [Anaerolineales bacterium]|nr:hypothetical protein [Anaerolineales bacterium]
MKNFRDIENLSAYLDGQLSESESKRLKARLESDAELDSVLSDIRSARNILKVLPKRKSPKNFTLTRKMVGLKPPMPRTYPLFRLATIFATMLLVFSFSVNALSPYVSFSAPQFTFGFGSGGGGAPAAAEAPATEEAMMFESAPADAAATESPAEILPQSTETARTTEETPTPKEAEPETFAQDSAEGLENQVEVTNEAPIPFNWIILFLVISLIGGLSLYIMRQSASSKWK